MQNWLEVFKFPSVERTTYDRYECTARNQIYPYIGDKVVGLLNSDIDLENRVMHLNRGVKEISKRDGVTAEKGREVKVGKLKSVTSKRDVPLNDTAIEMILDLRKEFYFGEDAPLIPDENGNFTRPVNFRKRRSASAVNTGRQFKSKLTLYARNKTTSEIILC